MFGPDKPNAMPPVYACGYSDLLEDVGEDGCFPVPTGPGLGVTYDWERHRARPDHPPRLRVGASLQTDARALFQGDAMR